MSPRWERWLYHFFCGLGCALVVAAGYCYFAPPPGPGVDAVEPEVELADCVPGQKRDVVYRLENRTGKPMRVLSVAGC